MIEVKSIVKRFGQPPNVFTVLDHLDATFPPGCLNYLVGPSGCGKTTLISIIGAMLKADEGQVRIFGQGLYSPDQGILPRYTSGVYARGRTRLYVSRGAGTHSFLPPRIFNRPEIDIITLKTPSR